jgi:hypothetical protein
MNKRQAQQRLSDVSEDLQIALTSVRFLREDVTSLASRTLSLSIPLAALARCESNLNSVYTVRLWAEFEATLRDYLRSVRRSKRLPRTDAQRLIDSVARRQNTPEWVRDRVHAIREHRNALVHEGGADSALELGRCRRRLNEFLEYLPRRW